MQEAVSRGSVPYRRLAHYALRWTVGLLLVATSLGKALDVPGFHDVLATYEIFPGWSSSSPSSTRSTAARRRSQRCSEGR